MKNYQIILFDLDGTLTDPGVGITNSVAYSLEKFGIIVNDKTQLYKFIGPPLLESFEKFYGFSEEQANTAIKYYREYFKDKGLFENIVYDGIENLLIKLQDNGKTLIVATSKPEVYARIILEHFGLAKYFKYIAGATFDSSRTKKDAVIEYALKANDISDKSDVIMIGDREHDVFGAHNNGVDSIGVLFGYGDHEELAHAQATYIAETVDDIEAILLTK